LTLAKLEETYNSAALFSKGILLSTDIEMSKLIQKSGNKEALEKYNDLFQNHLFLNIQKEKPIKERVIDIDSLQGVINKQERELILMSKEYGDYTRILKITWKDVQNHLSENDIAVEFLSFPLNEDSTMYMALTVRKDSKLPKMTILFEEKQLDESASTFSGQTIYVPSEKLKELVWTPLADEMKDIKNIYFSPSGKLYNIGIEYVPDMGNFNFYRLSSTRELVTGHENPTTCGNAILYGGIVYDTDPSVMIAESRSIQERSILSTEENDSETVTHEMVSRPRALTDSLNLRGHANYLPATKTEIENIGNSLKESGINAYEFSSTNATEESFKALGGQKVKVLHIATHGFYYTPDEAERKRELQFLQMQQVDGSNNHRYIEDKSMTRSGLLFSGANNALEGEDIPEGIDDGILTANEIAHVDLRGLDLVVLSACQTGLGEIAQGEGVFGLQRAFKKAGAKTLVMSLWKVDDNATQILMEKFYGNLSKGKSKRKAFNDAQKELRSIDNGKYDDPQFWAAFVMLDGIE